MVIRWKKEECKLTWTKPDREDEDLFYPPAFSGPVGDSLPSRLDTKVNKGEIWKDDDCTTSTRKLGPARAATDWNAEPILNPSVSTCVEPIEQCERDWSIFKVCAYHNKMKQSETNSFAWNQCESSSDEIIDKPAAHMSASKIVLRKDNVLMLTIWLIYFF